MSKKRVYFGTREKMSWVKAPSINMVRGVERYGNSGVFTNGGGYVNSSVGSHENYDLSWSLTDSADIGLVQAYYSGIYGTGLIYWSDPFVSHRNALPLGWSAPGLATDDVPSLFKGQKPTLVKTGPNELGLPVNSAVYLGAAGLQYREIWVPVPEGHSVAIGVVGSATGNGAVQYKKDNGAWTSLPFLTTSATTTVNTFLEGLGGGVSLRVQITTGTITLSAMSVKVYKIEGSGGSVVTNLATDPSFETTSGTVEVWRNYQFRPILSQALTGWQSQSFMTLESAIDGAVIRGTPTTSGDVAVCFRSGADIPTLAGEIFSVAFKVTNRHTEPKSFRAYFNTGTPITGPQVSIPAGETRDVVFNGFSVPSEVTLMRVGLISTGSVEPLDILVHDNSVVEKSPAWSGNYYSGSYSPDPDLTPYWTGAVNNSPSVLTGAKVAGVTPSGGVAIQSKKWVKHGEHSLRFIATIDSTHSFAQVSIGTGYRTVSVTRYQDQVITYAEGSAPTNRNKIYLIGGMTVYSEVAPNKAGDVELKVSNQAATSLILYGGQSIGQSVYFDALTIVEGKYNGPYFDGSTHSNENTIYYWNGTPNASTSTMRRLGRNSGANRFVLGGGNSGMKFVNNSFNRTGYSAVIGKGLESAGVQLKEVGSWLP